MTDNNIALAALALIGTLAAGFFALIRDQRVSNERAIDKLSATLSRVAEASDKVATATERGNREAEKRNGHLATITLQSRDQVIDAVTKVKEQKVTHQTVEHETVIERT